MSALVMSALQSKASLLSFALACGNSLQTLVIELESTQLVACPYIVYVRDLPIHCPPSCSVGCHKGHLPQFDKMLWAGGYRISSVDTKP